MILASQAGPADIRFALFLGCILIAVVGGYVLRKRGVLDPRWARGIMTAAIIGCDAPVALLAIWHLRIDPGVWKVPVAGGITGVLACLAGLAIARRAKMPPADAAVFGLQGGMGNVGYTLGGFLCFALWGIQGLALEQMYCLMWPFFAFMFCFPIARHYGGEARGGPAAPRPPLAAYGLALLARSLADVRSLPLYMSLAGLALNLWGPAPPGLIQQWRFIDMLMVAGIVLQFGSVGLTVEGRKVPAHWKTAAATAIVKFGLSPLLMLGVAIALGLGGTPLAVCLLLSAMPTALYSVLMANLFGLNRDLANTTFLLTHAACLAAAAAVAIVWQVM